jgi:hypothetical protein
MTNYHDTYSGLRSHVGSRLNFGAITDKYTLGVMAEKLRIVPFVLRQIKINPANGHKRAFDAGRRDAEKFSWQDIAEELKTVIHSNIYLFDEVIRRTLGRSELTRIHQAAGNIEHIAGDHSDIIRAASGPDKGDAFNVCGEYSKIPDADSAEAGRSIKYTPQFLKVRQGVTV